MNVSDPTPQTTGTRPLLSVTVITKNEADRIGRLLDSVASVTEVVVVDSGSDDDTVRISRTKGAVVIHHDWHGYAVQKQFAMKSVSGEWILNLDADEVVSHESLQEIYAAIKTCPSDVAAFSMPRLSCYLNRWIHHGGWYPDRKTRLVRRGMGRWVGDGLHEKLVVNGKTARLELPLFHYVYRGISDQIRTINSFSSLFAEHRVSAGSATYLVWGLFHATGKFLECAVWKLGILDGLPGLIIAVNSAFYIFLKHAKLWEKSLENKPPPDANR